MADPSAPETEPDDRRGVERIWHDLGIAAGFLTRLPVSPPTASGTAAAGTAGDGAWTAGAIGRAAGMFPVIGAGVGVAAALAMLLADRIGLHPLACALIAIGVQMAITGALHEDGLADLADGLGGGRDAASRLAIMRDSRIGTYGALALIVSVALKATLLSQLSSIETAAGALVSAAAVSRGVLPAVMRWTKPARADGLLVGVGRPDPPAVSVAIAGSLIIAVIAQGLGLGIAVCVIAAGGAIAVTVFVVRVLGGMTGDGLGAVQQKAELLVLATIAAAE
jgi:adenosylcobinamide-GDP ribazoletransferase